MKLIKYFRHLNLQNKLIFSISSLFVLIFITLLVIFRIQISNQLFNFEKETLLSLGNSIASSSLRSLYIYDYITIQRDISNISGIGDLSYVIIYDRNNIPVASTYYSENYRELLEKVLEEKSEYSESYNINEKSVVINKIEYNLRELTLPIKHKDQIWGSLRLAVSLDNLYSSIRNVEYLLIGIGLFVIILVVMGSRYLTRIVFEPLNRMIDATEKIAGGDLNVKVDIDADDEIGKLARSFNKMVEDLRNSREEIERWGKELEQKVHERTIQLEKSEKALLNILMDIKEANEKLKASEEKYRRFFEDDLTGDFIATPDGKLLDCNPAYAKIFGYDSVEEIKKENTHQRYPSPQAREEFLKLLKEKKQLYNYEIELRKKDGSPLYIIENVFAELSENGEIKTIRGYLFDNTERKKLEEKLLHSQKMEAIGTLAGGIAHDFNNVMGIVLGVLDMIGMKVQSNEIQKLLDMGKKAIERGAGVAKQLLLFARAEKGKFSAVKFSTIIKEVVNILRHSFPKNIEIEVILKAQNENVYADSTQLHMVLLNLCVNSRDAMPGGGKLTISIYNVSGQELSNKFVQANKDQYVALEVKDTGIGMTKEVMGRIFDPFFTTKEIGKGTGLGLSIIYGIVNAHNAFIDVESEPGKGTTFRVYFPALEIVETQPQDITTVYNLKGSETILLVEDEEFLLSTVKNLLQEAGYTVLTASNGYEGLKVYMDNYKNIDLVITDLGLPKMTGDEMFLEIKKINPNVFTIIMTGYIQLEKRSELYKLGIKEILSKPLHFDQILKTVRTTLDMVKK
ncbi:MAG: PAS/PAC sensor hybrid histidine kinase [Ignavibacteriae bacterium]|nr:MAG: PAS/PAC sensor hybrid histidine kinase [Ignavibacteriota bacterium]